MRILAMFFVLFLGGTFVPVQTALAQTGAQPTQANVEELRTNLRGALNQSRQFLGSLLSEAKSTTGLNDEQLFGVGVGLLGGLLAADVVGTGGFGTLIFAGSGGIFGKWVTTPK
ncbi:MAG: hypothetical protein WCF85_13305 [Rhodospirillaceae bacterium]